MLDSSFTPSTPWRPSWLIKSSVACHVGGAALGLSAPATWPWVLGALACNHALLAGTGLWPRSTWLGPNWLRLPLSAVQRHEVALTFDDGPHPEVTPAVLDILDAHQTQATFFCIAQHAQTYPRLCRDIVRRGHSVQNHSLHHRLYFSLLGPRAMAREVQAAQDILSDITGERPRFFRAPAGLRNPFLAPVLHRLGLQLASWTRRGFDTVQTNPQRVLARLTHHLAAGDIVLLHDGNAALTTRQQPIVLEVLPALLRQFSQAGLHCVSLPQAISENLCPP
jgi:peptidoglycan-N-acetylglucosamine deacetylase